MIKRLKNQANYFQETVITFEEITAVLGMIMIVTSLIFLRPILKTAFEISAYLVNFFN